MLTKDALKCHVVYSTILNQLDWSVACIDLFTNTHQHMRAVRQTTGRFGRRRRVCKPPQRCPVMKRSQNYKYI